MSTLRPLRRLLLALAVFCGLLLLASQALAQASALPDAVISLSSAPSPPTAIRPGQVQTFHWDIIASTTPLSVSYELLDLERDAVVDSQIYPGSSGLHITRPYTLPLTYTLPFGRLFERYRVRVEYYSLQAGNEANAEAILWVTQDTGSLVVQKFDDRDGDGVQDAGDSGAPGVSFFLAIQGQNVGETSGPDGRIAWANVPAGAYTLTEQVPPGRVPTTPPQRLVTVSAGLTTTASFGNRTIPGTLAAFVYQDYDGDGARDAIDLPFAGATASFVSPCGDDDSGLTGSDGKVIWPNRCVGHYTVTLTAPPSFAPTTPLSVTTNVTSSITSTVSFGIQPQGTLVACKFEDRDGDGQQDSGEGPVSGILVSYLNGFGARATGITGADGCYTWRQAPAALYAVNEEVVAGCRVTTTPYPPQVTVTRGQTTTVSLGNRCFGALIAHVFEDGDDDGLWDADEAPLGGVIVSWDNEYGANDFDVTDASGIISWTSQPVGVYTATAAVLPGYAATTPATQVVSITSGSPTVLLFGQRPDTSCVDGYKIDDFHIGLPGWVVQAQLADGSGPVHSALTDGAGYFRFELLPLGVYRFWEIQQSGWAPVTSPEFDVPVLTPGEQCLRVRFKNKQATPTPTSVARVSYLPVILKDATDLRVYEAAQAGVRMVDPIATPVDAGCVVGAMVDTLNVGLPGFIVDLKTAGGEAVGSTMTNGLGAFRFDGVPAGDYVLSEQPQTGWAPVTASQLDITVVEGSQCSAANFKVRQATSTPTNTPTALATASPTPTAPSTATPTSTSTPTASQTATPSPTASQTPTTTPTSTPTTVLGCIYGQKVDDLHAPLAGWTIHAQPAGGSGPVYTQVTDGAGGYRFEGLPLGVYHMWEDMQSGWEAATLPEFEVTLTDAQCVQTRFKNRQVTPNEGCIEGRKIDDLHVGLPGWTVRAQLASGAGSVLRTQTDGAGYYRFDNLPFGVWRLWEEMQSGWEPVTPPELQVTVAAAGACIETRFTNRQIGTTPTPPPFIRGLPHPKGIGVNSATNRVYVASRTTDQLYRINGATNAVLGTSTTGDEPFGVAVNSATAKVYVANHQSDSLMVFNGSTGGLLATIDFTTLGYGEPAFVVTDQIHNRVYVTLHAGGRLAVIDGAADALITTIEAEAGAFGLAVHAGLHRAYVSNRDTNSVIVVDTNSNTRLWNQTFAPGGEPFALAVDAQRDRLYVLYALFGNYPDRVAVYSLAASGASRIGTVEVEDGGADGGSGIAVNPTTGHVFVANSARDTVTVFDGPTSTVLATVAVGDDPGMLGVNPVTNRVYVSNRGDDTVQVFEDSF